MDCRKAFWLENGFASLDLTLRLVFLPTPQKKFGIMQRASCYYYKSPYDLVFSRGWFYLPCLANSTCPDSPIIFSSWPHACRELRIYRRFLVLCMPLEVKRKNHKLNRKLKTFCVALKIISLEKTVKLSTNKIIYSPCHFWWLLYISLLKILNWLDIGLRFCLWNYYRDVWLNCRVSAIAPVNGDFTLITLFLISSLITD